MEFIEITSGESCYPIQVIVLCLLTWKNSTWIAALP